jgi:hypothetical protein
MTGLGHRCPLHACGVCVGSCCGAPRCEGVECCMLRSRWARQLEHAVVVATCMHRCKCGARGGDREDDEGDDEWW